MSFLLSTATLFFIDHPRKLEEWGDDDGFGPMPDATDSMNFAGKNSRVVVLKHMFSVGDLEQDARLMLDLKEDVREECSTLGEVTNVVLYDVRSGLSTFTFADFLSTERAGRCHYSQIQRSSKCTSLCFSADYYLLFRQLLTIHTENGRPFFRQAKG